MYVPSQGACPVTSKEPAQNAETTATQGPHWPRPVCSSSLYLKTTWNIGFLQGQGQRTKLRPSESGNESQAGFSHLCCTSSFCYLFVTGCLLQYLLLFLAISQELLQQKGAGESCQKPSRPLLTGGLLWLSRKHLVQRPCHLPFSGPDRVQCFLPLGDFPA